MLDFNNLLVVVSFFLVLIARESRVKFLVKVTLCKRVKNPEIKNARCPLTKGVARLYVAYSHIQLKTDTEKNLQGFHFSANGVVESNAV